MFKYITPVLDANGNMALQNFTLTYVGPIYTSQSTSDYTIESSAFGLATDPTGKYYFGDLAISGSTNRKVIIYKIVDNKNVIVNNDAGLIEPAAGKITLNSFRPNDTSRIKITVTPNTLDLAPKRDQLISIDNDFVTITPEIDTIATAGSSGSINYTNTPRFK